MVVARLKGDRVATFLIQGRGIPDVNPFGAIADQQFVVGRIKGNAPSFGSIGGILEFLLDLEGVDIVDKASLFLPSQLHQSS